MKPAELKVFIDGLARRFENRVHNDHEGEPLGVDDVSGWGQFLDDPTGQDQVGPYGTSAGLIVRGLAQRGTDRLAEKVAAQVNRWWLDRTEAEEERRLGQTTRLSMLHLGLRLANIPNAVTTQQEIAATLMRSLRPDGMWGNYVIPGKVEDASPRLFPTAIAILSFTLLRPNSETIPPELLLAADRLEEKFLGARDLPRLHVAAACAAILSVKRKPTNKDVIKKMERLAYATQPSLPDLGVYFYDYEYRSGKDSIAFGRDYFIVPTEVLLGIAGFQTAAPAYLRLRAEQSLRALLKNIAGYDGFYRPDNEQRVSSLNQCWVAIYLALAAERQQAIVFARGSYAILRYRSDSTGKDASMLALCCAGIAFGFWVESLPLFQAGSVRMYMLRACEAILAFAAARLYAPIFLKRLLPGRE
jgi:hypothetical protein